MNEYLPHFPKPLLDDLVQGRILPIVGAGMSRNAAVPAGAKMPLWDGLGKAFAAEIPAYPYSGTLDAISAYAHDFSRVKLVERLADLLLVDRASPGEAHKAFCSLPFSLVCTTNFDFLLERGYADAIRYCRPVIDEDQLSVGGRDSELLLLKLHGDLHHPQRLVVTEEDYDRFVETYPLLSTYLANLLIGRTPLLVGYSLDDPDFRQIWQVVTDRLGRLRRPAYSMMVDASATEIARFARRGVRVVNLPGSTSDYGKILASAFAELGAYWSSNLISAGQVTEEEPLKELSLPHDAKTRLCFFAVPLSLLSSYREQVFPVVERHGFVPVSANDVIVPGENVAAKVQTLIERSAVVVVDISSQWTAFELGIALSKLDKGRVLVVAEMNRAIPVDVAEAVCVLRRAGPFSESDEFMEKVDAWFARAAADIGPQLLEEPKRLLEAHEYRAAVLSALTLLEVRLRDRLGGTVPLPGRPLPMFQLLESAMSSKVIDAKTAQKIKEWMRVRNSVAHSLASLRAEDAEEIVNGTLAIIKKLTTPPPKKRKRGSR